MVREKGQKRTRRLALQEIPTEQSLVEWSSFSEEMCKETGVIMGDLNSRLTFEPLHNLHLEVFKLLKSFFIHYLSSEDVYSHSAGPSGKQKRLRLRKSLLLGACYRILGLIEELYTLPELHVSFAKREKQHSLMVCSQGMNCKRCSKEKTTARWI